MRVILSNSIEDNFSQFVVVRDITKIRDLSGVTTLVIHDFKEADFSVGVLLSEFKAKGIENFLYINENPVKTVESAIIGAGGYVFKESFYLDDEEELATLVDEIESDDSQSTALVSQVDAAIEILKSFVDGVETKNARVFMPAYQDVVKNALIEVEQANQKNELMINSMGESILETYRKAGDLISKYNEQSKKLSEKLNELESVAQTNQMGRGNGFGNSMSFFPTFQYTGSTKILVIREYAPCRYLGSFATGYRHHLHYEKNVRARLVFVVQKGYGISSRYSDVVFITEESRGLSSLYSSDVIATNTPKKDILRELAGNGAEVVIFVDRLYGSQDIVAGRVKRINAVSSASDITRFNLRPEETICTVSEIPGTFCCIKTFKNYPSEKDGRLAVYNKGYEQAYAKLDNLIQLKR